MESIRLLNVGKSYGGARVIDDVSLDIAGNEFIVFLGASGCGKSTLLRLIAGLETLDAGEIRIGERRIDHLPPGERSVAMVFQHYALYPHMSVRDNLSFGLRNAGLPKSTIAARVAAAAQMLEIAELLDRKPGQISGGQRQRVAIGRAIVKEPKVFLFDEPLSNLDAALRLRTRIEIAQLHQRVKAATIFVTHDQVEAMTLADRIVVLHRQRIEQVGTPMEIYDRPATEFVATFVGSPPMNLLAATIDARDGPATIVRLADGTSVRTGIDASPIPAGTSTETRRTAGSDLARCARRRRHAGPGAVRRTPRRPHARPRCTRHGPEADRGGQRPKPPGRRRHRGIAVRSARNASVRRVARLPRDLGRGRLTWPAATFTGNPGRAGRTSCSSRPISRSTHC